MKPLEIEHLRITDGKTGNETLAQVAMLTGYNINELRTVAPMRLLKSSGWYGRDFRTLFHLLHFNCPPRFIPFSPDGPHPCLARLGLSNRGKVAYMQDGHSRNAARQWWSTTVYYNGLLYDPHEEAPYPLADLHEHYRITSMLPVWISTESVIREL